jgi:hypothetical protein
MVHPQPVCRPNGPTIPRVTHAIRRTVGPLGLTEWSGIVHLQGLRPWLGERLAPWAGRRPVRAQPPRTAHKPNCAPQRDLNGTQQPAVPHPAITVNRPNGPVIPPARPTGPGLGRGTPPPPSPFVGPTGQPFPESPTRCVARSDRWEEDSAPGETWCPNTPGPKPRPFCQPANPRSHRERLFFRTGGLSGRYGLSGGGGTGGEGGQEFLSISLWRFPGGFR